MKALTAAAAVAVVVVVAAVVVVVIVAVAVADGTKKVTEVIPGALLEVLALYQELEFLDFLLMAQHFSPGLSLLRRSSASSFSKDGKRKCIWQRSFGAEARWPAAVLLTRTRGKNRRRIP